MQSFGPRPQSYEIYENGKLNMDLAKFDLLENKILGLVERLQEAEKKSGKLENELKEAQSQLEAASEERAAILKKIDELITRLDI
ncbi:MAG: hypothetical protein LBQ12_12035 [Deltaproteobacteria bacterium]|jgi:sugar-specific transcriptional regulator TrmB|nr:hypothetical protein [Deltaproteobacteria bacterium]